MAQTEDETLYQLWFNYYRYDSKSDKLKVYSDYGARFLLTGGPWSQLNVRPSVRYRLNESVELRGLFGAFLTMEPSTTTIELRPAQAVVWRWPRTSYVQGRHRLMVEERFFSEFEPETFSYATRVRVRPMFYINFKPNTNSNYWYSIVRTELFANLFDDTVEEQFRNRSRFQLGIGRQADIKWRYEFYVTFEDNFATAENQNTDKIMFQIRVKQNLFKD